MSLATAETDPDAAKMPSAPMREQILYLPGDPARPVQLEVTLFEPPGNGPFPLAVMNHGAEGHPRDAPRYRISFSIDYLLSRGYAVIVPMMRGFAGSGGEAVAMGCDLARLGKLNARDILGVIDAMKTRSDIDGSRVLVLGQSFGGWNSLALATIATPEIKGVVNFVGGLHSSACGQQDEAMFEGMEQFGRKARIPSIWFYGERDKLFPESVWRMDYERFTRAGGKAELVDFGNIDDAHNLLGHADHVDLWVPRLDTWLAGLDMPSREVFPEYMPPPRPPKTNYALLGDIAAVPLIGREHPNFYQKFLDTTDRPRVIVISPHMAYQQYGGFDPVGRAIAECAKQGGPCMPYAYDDDVVWTGPRAGDTARIAGMPILGKAAKSGLVTNIENITSVTASCAPSPLPLVTLTSPPANGSVQFVADKAPAKFGSGNPLSACNNIEIPIIRLMYKSLPGLVGTDFFTIKIVKSEQNQEIIKFSVHVS